jgi:hypothetical protein
MVRKLFRSVLGYDAVIPCEPEDSPEIKPEDPELVKKILERAANLENLRPPMPRQAGLTPGGPPVDSEMMRENTMLRQHLREAHVQMQEMQETIGAMHRSLEGQRPPEPMQASAAHEGAHVEPSSQTAAASAASPANDPNRLVTKREVKGVLHRLHGQGVKGRDLQALKERCLAGEVTHAQMREWANELLAGARA